MAALILLSWCVSCHSPQPTPVTVLPQGLLPSQAQVAEVRGFGARGRNPGGAWRKLQLSDWLAMGATVQTPPTTGLTLRLYEAGLLVHLKTNTVVRLEQLAYRRDGAAVTTFTVLDLSQGEVAVDDSNLTPGSEFEIRTPQGTTRIPPRGAR
ncbi:MAG: hypothetical protein HZA90_03325 [Verrucomicrobia bacterium]|nr:hypothetical protein [Verrucomicrobiota bacterium]